MRIRRALVAPDKFRGSLSAVHAAAAMASGLRRGGLQVVEAPLSDGGEGFAEVMLGAAGGHRSSAAAHDASGAPVTASFGVTSVGDAVVETAEAIGLARLGRPNDPIAASSTGAGELLAAALATGPRRILVGLGGSASTDGGLGAVEALGWSLRGCEVLVACDVRTRFLDAARIYGPQKGADAAQVEQLSARLAAVARRYAKRLGVDVTAVDGAGAAGGLAGGLAALGATLVPGFTLVSAVLGLHRLFEGTDAVVTGEGALDATSLQGKVVGGVLDLGRQHGIRRRAVVAGRTEPGTACSLRRDGVTVRSLSEQAVPPVDPMADAARLLVNICEQLTTELL